MEENSENTEQQKETAELYGLNTKMQTAKTPLKNSGGASDVFEAAEYGKVKSKKIHQVYKKNDSVDAMARSTLDLLADTSRQVIKEMDARQKDQLNSIINRSYTPRKKVDNTSELDKVMSMICTF